VDIRVNVTQKDIEKGRCGLILLCPVALAIRRALPEIMSLRYVGIKSINVDGHVFDFPIPIARFISDFDHGRAVKPFKFILRFRESA